MNRDKKPAFKHISKFQGKFLITHGIWRNSIIHSMQGFIGYRFAKNPAEVINMNPAYNLFSIAQYGGDTEFYRILECLHRPSFPAQYNACTQYDQSFAQGLHLPNAFLP